MGNSEVGHMNLGAGRVIYQDMTRIDIAIEDGSLAANPVLRQVMDTTRGSTGRLHLLGLLSDGGVHSHLNHLLALLRLARDAGVPETYVHVFLDGRDTPPSSGLGFVEGLEAGFRDLGYGRIATLTGRYYAMDRDKRWDRVAVAHAALTAGAGAGVEDALAGVRAAYAAGETDEFVRPLNVLGPDGQPQGLIRDGDGIFCFNFRADRARELARSLFEPDFAEFPRRTAPVPAVFATMTRYDATFPLPVAFPPQSVDRCLGQVVSDLGLRQLRLAETEKYAHVTYFFNCGREEPYPGEERLLVPSPREVATYDLKPEMSVHKVRDAFLEAWVSGAYALGVVNLANMDMVGHTGDITAAVRAVEAVDGCVGSIVECVLASGGTVLLTADHGNAEEMVDAAGGPQTAHSKNRVPFVLVGPDSAGPRPALRAGRLGDVAPTILQLWNLPKPEEMTGESLLPEDYRP
jgi:2,3-bisphosphoglycerate-independent phosphoglycerate mutase